MDSQTTAGGGAATAGMMTADRTTNLIVALVAGGHISVLIKTALAPIERAKLLLQVQDVSQTITADKRYKGIIDVLVRVPKEQGFSALWRGNVASIVRLIPHQLATFAFHDHFKRYFMRGVDKKTDYCGHFTANLAAGGAAGATSLCFAYPFDYARTRLGADVGKGSSREFKGLADCLLKTVRSDGPIGLYRGFFVSVQGIIIYRAAFFGLFDTAKMLMEGDSEKKLNFFATWGIAQVTTITAGVLSYPWNTVRRRMMMQSGRKEILYKNAWDCVFKIVKNEGVKGFFKGGLAGVIRSTARALVLVGYDWAQKYF